MHLGGWQGGGRVGCCFYIAEELTILDIRNVTEPNDIRITIEKVISGWLVLEFSF